MPEESQSSPKKKPGVPKRAKSAANSARLKAAALNLVIVESPAKAKTIGRYLGDGYAVMASYGHVRDLPAKEFGVDIENGFKPKYVIPTNRQRIIPDLRRYARYAPAVYLASDPDREGEAIAWHLKEALGVGEERSHRVIFNELTSSAIRRAFEHPGKLDLNKINAQQARRILDRIVGYKLSPLLRKKITKGLSAGRVQSVAVRLIVDREREIAAFVPDEFWKIEAKLSKGRAVFPAELEELDGKQVELKNEAQAKAALAAIEGTEPAVESVEVKRVFNNPAPPLTTSLMQQQASTRLNFTARKTMLIAQQLYEGVDIGGEGTVGLITYMRTDSTRVAAEALTEVREYISAHFGGEYLPEKPNKYPSGRSAQEAHEAIRPTAVARTPDILRKSLTGDQFRLYRLVWERFVASQMNPATYEATTAAIRSGPAKLTARGRTRIFDGHTRVAGEADKKQAAKLPPLQQGDDLQLAALESSQHFTKPPGRYSEASLVKTLEKLGIGRPSTYAPIITTIQDRGYVRREQRQFIATPLGILVTDKLVKHFPDILDVAFTSNMEDLLDGIEEGRDEWTSVLSRFYGPFAKDLELAARDMTSEKEETMGTCETCGKPMAVRWSKRGKFLGCTGYPECRQTVQLCPQCGNPVKLVKAADGKDVLGCSKYPECNYTAPICEKCGRPMVTRRGPRGSFLGCSGFPRCQNIISLCAKCGKPMIRRTTPEGEFLVCTGEPECDNVKKARPVVSRPPEPTSETCQKCGAPMVIRTGRRGRFIACSAYPRCRNTKSLPEEVAGEP